MPDHHQDLPGKPGRERTCLSNTRVEPWQVREMTSCNLGEDKLKRADAYFVKPVQCTGSSSVKFDIITGDRHQFWY
jgi:hypothetical protein